MKERTGTKSKGGGGVGGVVDGWTFIEAGFNCTEHSMNFT